MIHRPYAAALYGASILCVATAALEAGEQPATAIGPTAAHAAVAAELERAILEQMEDKQLPALSIAITDGAEFVWARGFGAAGGRHGGPANAGTVYRAGSVSKLFTAIAILQLVERGELELDLPVTRYLPDFRPRNPFGVEITLRHLLSHRSGLVREPPLGSYFDSSEPTLAESVKSLNATALVYEPGRRIKYSNAGVAVAGLVLERLSGRPFELYVREAVLEPLEMASSAFRLEPKLEARLATAYMWSYDGRLFEAPRFELGTPAAGSLYSTVTDLGKLLICLAAGGRGPRGAILEPETLEAMWKLQNAAPGQKQGFGLGFSLSELDGRRRIGHGGAVYGFATALQALPDERLGAVAVTSIDCANSVVERLAEHALRCLLAARAGTPLPRLEAGRAPDPDLARRLQGRYESGGREIGLYLRQGALLLEGRAFTVELKSFGESLIADGRLAHGDELRFERATVLLNGKACARLADPLPAPPPARWSGLIGEYGWDHNILFILEKHGKLHALIEWFFSYPLEELSPGVFAFPDYGLYHGEKLIFTRDGDGRATRVEAASVVFPRRHGPAGGETFRIAPVRPVEALRKEALEAMPPAEDGELRPPELVDLAGLDAAIRFDIRYAGTNNFLSTVFYEEARAFLQRPAAEALLRAHRRVKEHGYGLLIHDAYRPWHVTKMFWEATPEEKRMFVADPAKGSRHNRGCAVDLTLYELASGEPVEMVAGYDEFSERAFPDYPGGTSRQRWLRDLLRAAMEAEGFTVYEHEWWHFDHADWKLYPILNLPFSALRREARSY